MHRFKRLFARLLGVDQTRSFDAAAWRRRAGEGASSFGSYGPESIAASDTIRRRARYGAANNAWIANGVEALESNIVGSGIRANSAHPDENTREQLQSQWNLWTKNCDADRRTDFAGIQAALVRALAVDGESFLQFVQPDDQLRLRQIPTELVDIAHTVELGGGARIIAGIEFDAAGERVAYHIRPADPLAAFETHAPPVRVPASEILHLYRPLGPGQVRGVSWLSSVLTRANELDQYEDALLVGAKVAAMHAGFLVDMNGAGGGLPYEGVQDGTIMESGLEPGTLKVLPGGYDIKFSTPQQAEQGMDFAKLQLRAMAAGLGVPEYLLTGDLSGANYSSLRAGSIEFRRRIEAVQFHILIPQILRPVWERFVTVSVLSGNLDAPGFESAVEDYLAVEFIPAALAWVDPLKDVEATERMIAAGLTSRRRAVAERGYSIEDLDAEIISDRQREESLGLNIKREEANA